MFFYAQQKYSINELSIKILPKSTKVRLHGNNVHDVFFAHVISADAQINRRGNGKVILGPAGHGLRAWPAGKNKKWRKC